MKEDLSKFEKIDTELEIVKETEKAIAVRVSCPTFFDEDNKIIKWIPKSVALVENNTLKALKGWFIDKECGDWYELVSKEAVARFEKWLETRFTRKTAKKTAKRA